MKKWDALTQPTITAHKKGTDVDFRYMNTSGQPTNDYNQKDSDRCNAFVKVLKKYGCTRIYSHNSCVSGTTHASGHKNHLHAGWRS